MTILIGVFNNIVSHLAYRRIDCWSLFHKLYEDIPVPTPHRGRCVARVVALLVEWKLLYGGDSGGRGYLQLLRSAIDHFCAAKTQSEDGALHRYRIRKCVCRLFVACVDRRGLLVKLGYLGKPDDPETIGKVIAAQDVETELLPLAAFDGDDQLVKELLARGADVTFTSDLFGTALYAASLKGNESLVNLFLEHGAPVNTEAGNLGEAIQAAATAGSTQCVRRLLSAGADIQTAGSRGYREPLILATIHWDVSMMRLLLENGASYEETYQLAVDMSIQGGLYAPPLAAAAAIGNNDAIRLLLDHGAKVNDHNNEGMTALNLAARAGHESTVLFLIENGADTTGSRKVAERDGGNGSEDGHAEFEGPWESLLHSAAFGGSEKLVNLALELGYDVQGLSYREDARYTPLWYAAEGRHFAILQLLMAHGAYVRDPGDYPDPIYGRKMWL
jgi:ankyrin repeat protein